MGIVIRCCSFVMVAALAAACDPGQDPVAAVTAPTPVPPPAPAPQPVLPPTVAVTCNGGSSFCTIAHSASATIAWSSLNTVSCTVEPGGWTGTSGSQSTGPLSATAAYAVRCVGSNGNSVSATSNVTVSPPLVPGGPGPPTIAFTTVPPRGSSNDLKGSIRHVSTTGHSVAVFIRVGGWWTKPFANSPLTRIDTLGNWSADITTGGNDPAAVEVVAFLVTADHRPQVALDAESLPILVNGRDVLAVVRALR